MKLKTECIILILSLFFAQTVFIDFASYPALNASLQKTCRRAHIPTSNFYNELPNPVIEVDSSGVIRKANAAALNIFSPDIIGKPLVEAFKMTTETIYEHKDRIFRFMASETGNGTILSGMDVTGDFMDALTEICYRKDYLYPRLREAVVFSTHDGPVSVVTIDGDDIKAVNDAFGHSEGDRVIIAMANAIKASIRESDILFRSGGDEFVIILPNTSAEEARIVAERIAGEFKNGLMTNNGNFHPKTISLGYTTFTPNENMTTAMKREPMLLRNTCELIIETSDQALYRAKETGKDRAFYLELELGSLQE
ncbi:MAG: GGDEF domain-containing protein [Candidatus Omnitrophica bacterium]|nr:GGDEF domain-containing protein [Candidatus Omnitrophota bacterium]